MPSRHAYNYKPSLLERLHAWAFGQRCELHLNGDPKRPCARRAVGRFALAQEFGTVQADLCQQCLDFKLRQIEETPWGIAEAAADAWQTGTWKTVLREYKPSWLGALLLRLGLDR